MIADLTLREALLVAVLPSLVAIVGVVVTALASLHQARVTAEREDRRITEERAHQRQLALDDHAHQSAIERATFFRNERPTSYAKVRQTADEALKNWALLTVIWNSNQAWEETVKQDARSALGRWQNARSEADLLASRGVRECMQAVDDRLGELENRRMSLEAMRSMLTDPPEPSGAVDFSLKDAEDLKNSALLGALLDAMRSDLDSVEP